jgi:hypothetical protein
LQNKFLVTGYFTISRCINEAFPASFGAAGGRVEQD